SASFHSPCLSCSRPNPLGFRFCCWCGTPASAVAPWTAPVVGQSVDPIDEEYIRSRLQTLSVFRDQISRFKNPNAEFCRFSSFVSSLSSPIATLAAQPSHVIAYLLNKDHRGLTQYHCRGCPHATLARPQQRSVLECDGSCQVRQSCPHASIPYNPAICPIRADPNVLRTARSQLKSAFFHAGFTDRWSPFSPGSNPVDSLDVDDFLELVSAEAAEHAVAPIQATPVFPEDLHAILTLCRSELAIVNADRAAFPLRRRLVWLQLIALILVIAHSGHRTSDIIQCPPAAFWWLPAESGVLITLFQHKTRSKSGSLQRLALTPMPEDLDFCPIAALSAYKEEARITAVDFWDLRFVFPPLTAAGNPRAIRPTSAVFRSLFSGLASQAGCPGLSLHGCRVSKAVAARLSQVSLQDSLASSRVMHAGGWASSSAADRYSRLAVAVDHLSPNRDSPNTKPNHYY
ncbi:hypothetical protein HDU76_010442, partial [Blyttiomyces sp. JEL0837]